MFSELIKSLRAKSGLSQSALAKSVGVSPGNVGDWETGRSKPGYNALAALTRVFDVSADYLLELDTSPVKTGGSELLDLDALKEEQGLTCDGIPLDDLEIDLVAMFRLLPPSHQEEVFDLVYFKYKRHVEQKKESLFSEYRAGSASEKSDPAEGGEAQGGIA